MLLSHQVAPNLKIEVPPNDGSHTLAVVLQYEGVVDLAGVSAALKLPAGFKASLPLTSDKNRLDIALSIYRGHIYPSQSDVDGHPLHPHPSHFYQVEFRSFGR